AKTSSVSQVGLDAATDSVLFFPTGGVSFCSGVDHARGSFGEPKVTPPFSFTRFLTLPLKTLPTALTCWPYRNMALRDGARTSTRTSSVAKGRTASRHCRPAPPRQTEALSSRTSRSRPLETSQPSGARAKNERSESVQGS